MSCNKDSSISILFNLKLSIVNSDNNIIYNTSLSLVPFSIPIMTTDQGSATFFDVKGKNKLQFFTVHNLDIIYLPYFILNKMI